MTASLNFDLSVFDKIDPTARQDALDFVTDLTNFTTLYLGLVNECYEMVDELDDVVLDSGTRLLRQLFELKDVTWPQLRIYVETLFDDDEPLTVRIWLLAENRAIELSESVLRAVATTQLYNGVLLSNLDGLLQLHREVSHRATWRMSEINYCR